MCSFNLLLKTHAHVRYSCYAVVCIILNVSVVGVFPISELIVRFTMYVRSVSWEINEHIHL